MPVGFGLDIAEVIRGVVGRGLREYPANGRGEVVVDLEQIVYRMRVPVDEHRQPARVVEYADLLVGRIYLDAPPLVVLAECHKARFLHGHGSHVHRCASEPHDYTVDEVAVGYGVKRPAYITARTRRHGTRVRACACVDPCSGRLQSCARIRILGHVVGRYRYLFVHIHAFRNADAPVYLRCAVRLRLSEHNLLSRQKVDVRVTGEYHVSVHVSEVAHRRPIGVASVS